MASGVHPLEGAVFQLLWENPNKSAAFGETDINVDLTPYDAVLVIASYSAITHALVSEIAPVGDSGRLKAVGNFASNVAYCVYRAFIVYDSYVHFEEAYRRTLTASSGSDGNSDNCIPWYIFGIKGIRGGI